MYDHLLGEIVEKHASRAVVRCAGVGYEVRVIAVIKGAAGPDYDPDADGAYLTDDEAIARAGGGPLVSATE